MGRNAMFGESAFTLKLSGLQSLFALKRKVVIPYRTVRNVHVDVFDAPAWMLRMPGTSIASLHIYEGSFRYAHEWCFLSYKGRKPVVMIETDGHDRYKYVIFEMDNPTEVAAELRRRVRECS